jgi:hypothetical protein
MLADLKARAPALTLDEMVAEIKRIGDRLAELQQANREGRT